MSNLWIWLFPYEVHGHGVTSNGRAEGICHRPFRPEPEVSDGVWPRRQAELRDAHSHRRRDRITVQKNDRCAATGHWLAPHLLLSVVTNLVALHASPILIDGDDFPVHQD